MTLHLPCDQQTEEETGRKRADRMLDSECEMADLRRVRLLEIDLSQDNPSWQHSLFQSLPQAI
jgi:hypothetical protein